eukprot:452124-Amphidinium_carterae.1
MEVPINGAFIFFLEFLAQLLSIILFRRQLAEDVLSFIDNTPATFVLLSGYSRNEGVNNLVGLYWVLCSKLGLRPWFEWVPSAANVADAVSRENFKLAQDAGWHQVHAELADIWAVVLKAASDSQYAYHQAPSDLLHV